MALSDAPTWAEKYRPSPAWRYFGGDELTCKSEWYLDEGEQIKIRTVMPMDEFMKVNADLRSLTSGRKWDDGMALAARVPMHIWQRELAEPIRQEDKAHISRWLNDPDHAQFRTKEGKV